VLLNSSIHDAVDCINQLTFIQHLSPDLRRKKAQEAQDVKDSKDEREIKAAMDAADIEAVQSASALRKIEEAETVAQVADQIVRMLTSIGSLLRDELSLKRTDHRAVSTHEIAKKCVTRCDTIIRGVRIGFSRLPPAEGEDANTLAVLEDVLSDLNSHKEDFFDLSKGAAEIVARPYWFSPSSWLTSIISAYGKKVHPGVELKSNENIPEGKIKLLGDRTKLRRVVTNFFSNAVKFTRKGSISLNTTVSLLGDGHAKLSVRVVDTGPGISPEALPKIGGSYGYQEERTKKLQNGGGHGIGLAASFATINMFGGTQIVSSEGEGAGSTFGFDVTLPVVRG
jgi:signal transduction histidine kinase